MPTSLPPRSHGFAWPTSIAISISVAAVLALSRLVSVTGDVSLVWPPLGIAMGLMLVRGPQALAPVLAGLVVWAVASGQDPRLIPVALLEMGVGAWVGVQAYRRLWRRATGALADMLRLHTCGMLVAAPLSALLGATGFHALGLYAEMGFGELFFAFWVTEAMGVLLFAPLVRALAQDGIAPWFAEATLAWRWLAVLAATLTLAALLRSDLRDIVALLAGLLVAWPAMRAHPSLLHALVMVLTAALLALGLAGDSAISNRVVLELVLRIAALAVLAQLLNAVSVERAHMLARERDAGRRDLLTGLSNERALREQLEGCAGVLLMLRLEGFTGLTDLVGASTADGIERTVAHVLQDQSNPPRQAARLGPGRYALLLPGMTLAQAQPLAHVLYTALNHRAFRGADDVVALRPTLAGVATAGQAPETVLTGVRQALAQAAASADERIAFAADSHSLWQAQREEVRRQEQVKRALVEQRFVLFAQPIVPLSGTATGLHCEVLLRLRDDNDAVLSPAHFMPAAERAQLMGAIDRYVIEHLLRWLAAHPQASRRVSKCAINLSGWSVSDPGLAPWIQAMLQTHGIDPRTLCFEITESQAISNREHARQLIQGLRALGASVSLDDFGTGLATFDYLKSFPFDYLKIDGSFVKTLEHSPVDQAIVRSITEVARCMGLATIAEFVESESTAALLRRFGVDYAQGYALGKPRPLAEILEEVEVPANS